MPMLKNYYVYIMASKSRTLYTGVTGNLERRVLQPRGKLLPGFTARYNINRLVYYEVSGEIAAAIAREKQIKSWGRGKKIALIESLNRDWKDLSAAWFGGLGGFPGAQVEGRQSEIPRSARNDIRALRHHAGALRTANRPDQIPNSGTKVRKCPMTVEVLMTLADGEVAYPKKDGKRATRD